VFTDLVQVGSYIVIPLIVLAAYRFQERGATAAIAIISIIAIWGTKIGHGPFGRASLNDSLLRIQLFVSVMALTALVLATLIREKIALYNEGQAQLKEKEILLGEIHHRVKNNLQVISSLLSLQMRDAEPATRTVLVENITRVQTMSLIHDKLYEQTSLAQIDLAKYLNELVQMILSCYPSSGNVLLNVDCEPIHIDVEKAIPCGLIVNEIVTNSLKHAFAGKESGEIQVTARRIDGLIQIEVGDDGDGFPENADFEKKHGLGFKLIKSLIAQLEGHLRIENHSGTHFHFDFKA